MAADSGSCDIVYSFVFFSGSVCVMSLCWELSAWCFPLACCSNMWDMSACRLIIGLLCVMPWHEMMPCTSLHVVQSSCRVVCGVDAIIFVKVRKGLRKLHLSCELTHAYALALCKAWANRLWQLWTLWTWMCSNKTIYSKTLASLCNFLMQNKYHSTNISHVPACSSICLPLLLHSTTCLNCREVLKSDF